MKDFAVTSKSFALYEAFKKEAESRGWVYNTEFSSFDSERIKGPEQCLYFSNDWHELEKGICAFAFSSWHERISLETRWNDALSYLDLINTPTLINSKTHVTLQEIADWKGVSINDLTIGL